MEQLKHNPTNFWHGVAQTQYYKLLTHLVEIHVNMITHHRFWLSHDIILGHKTPTGGLSIGLNEAEYTSSMHVFAQPFTCVVTSSFCLVDAMELWFQQQIFSKICQKYLVWGMNLILYCRMNKNVLQYKLNLGSGRKREEGLASLALCHIFLTRLNVA